MSETVKTIVFRADSSDLTSVINQLNSDMEGFSSSEIELAKATRDASKALDEQAKAAGLTKSELVSARKAIDASANRSARSADAASRAQTEGAKAVKESQLELLEMFGGPSKDSVDKLSKAAATLGAEYVVVAGLAGALVGGLAAGVVVFAAATAGAIGAAYAAGDLARSLEEVKGLGKLEGFGVDDKEIDQFNNLNGTMDALGVIADRMAVNFGTILGPALEQAGMIAIKFGLMALDGWNALAKGGEVIPMVATFISKMLIESLTLGISTMAEMVAVAGHMAKALGMDSVGDKLIGIRDSWDAVQDSFASDVATYAIEKTVFVMDELDKGTADYDDRVQELVGTMVKSAEATRNAADASKNDAEAKKKQAEEIRAAKVALDAWNKSLQESEKFAKEQIKTYDGAVDGLWEIADVTNQVGMADHQKALQAIDDARAEQTAKADALLGTALLATSTDAGRETAYAAHKQALLTIEENHAAETLAVNMANNKKIQDENEKLEKEKHDTLVANVEAGLQLASELVGQASSVIGEYLGKFTDALGETMDRLSSVRDGLKELGDTGEETARLTGDALMKAYLDGEVSLDELSDAQKENLESSLKEEEKILKKKAKIEREAAMKAFKMQKATSVAEALINSALAVIAAFKLGPIAGGIAAPIIAGLTGAQVALIMNQEPSFHDGGGIGQLTTGSFQSQYANDEVSIRAQKGEWIVSRQGVATLGEDTLRNANKGMAPDRGLRVFQMYDGKIISEATQDQLKTNSDLRASLNKTRPGHRNK